MEILARLYDSANSMPLSGMPDFTRDERILLRLHERKDIFEEYYSADTDLDLEEVNDTASVLSSSQNHDSFGRPQVQRAGSSGSQGQMYLSAPSNVEGRTTPDLRKGLPKDTHFFETEAKFGKITVPMRIPMTVFDGDIGDVSVTLPARLALLIKL